MENLKALVYGKELTDHQRALAKQEFEKLVKACKEKKSKIYVSEKNEGTSYPFWIIIDPDQNFKKNIYGVYNITSMITGIWFSREAAEEHLRNKRHHYSENAIVFCMSGYDSLDYKKAVNNGTGLSAK